MARSDVPFAVELTDAEGWGYGPDDFRRFMRMDPEGTLVAWEDERRVGITTATSYGVVAWIGNVIVVEEARGEGVGRALMDAALAYTEEGGAEGVWLNAYAHVEGFYEAMEFRSVGRTGRYEGLPEGRLHDEVRLVHAHELDDVVAWDASHFGVPRTKVLRAFYHDYGGSFYIWDGGDRRGFAVGAPYSGGVDVAPFVVDPDSPTAAEALFEHLAACHPETTVGLAVPHENANALNLVKKYGLEPSFETVRMVRGRKTPAFEPAAVFGLGGLEKG